jgi:hypothetical protein
VTKTWTSIKDYITDAFGGVVERDCVYPTCMVEMDGCRTCEHACPFERAKRGREAAAK